MSVHDYLESGFKIFGLYSADKGICECGNLKCKALFKHPRIKNWQKVPKWSSEQVDAMENSKQFKTGFGVLIEGLLVVDVDARNGGLKSFERLNMDLIKESGFVVETGSCDGSMHLYFKIDNQMSFSQSLPEYPGIDFKTSGFVVGMGSMHKSGFLYEKMKGHPDEITYAPIALVNLLSRKNQFKSEIQGNCFEYDIKEIENMLSYVDPDCEYDRWVRCGMSVHHATNGTGVNIFDQWSSKSKKYKEGEIDKKWHSFGKAMNPVTIGTLFRYAEENGYRPPVKFTKIEIVESEGHPFNIDHIDILRPPGFVGSVAEWINSQCRYKREHLAVAAALVSIGNIGGLRYVDDLTGATANLFSFCVAGSATGKEAIQQAITKLHRAAEISGAVHGSIKSEQEVTRNLIRNQSAYYIIDEIGFLISKISNAQKKGGASYLDGIIGILMAVYSKANGYLLLTGDAKEEVRKSLITEFASIEKRLSENEGDESALNTRLEGIKKSLDHLDSGLERPFLSLIGFTTPSTFTDFVNFEQSTNGFIGRSLIFTEKETNPKAKRNFIPSGMTDKLKYTLQCIYSGGDSEKRSRVESVGDVSTISTDPIAIEMLDKCLDFIEEYAEKHKCETSLEAIVRRGYEMICKISLILAIPSGVRTAEMIKWAYAITRKDIDDKINLVLSNSQEASSFGALSSKIRNMLDKDHGEMLGTISNRLRSYSKADIETTVKKLLEKNVLRCENIVNVRNKKTYKKYFISS